MNLNLGLDFNNLGDSELQNLLNNMSQQQLMQVRMMKTLLQTNPLLPSCLEARWAAVMPQVLQAFLEELVGRE